MTNAESRFEKRGSSESTGFPETVRDPNVETGWCSVLHGMGFVFRRFIYTYVLFVNLTKKKKRKAFKPNKN